MAKPLAVVAVGGNSLIVDEDHVSIPYQSEVAAHTAAKIADLIEDGWNVVITHGNGPQVGFILRRCEIGRKEVPPIPMNYATSNTQGSIGYMFQKALYNEMISRGVERSVVTLITQTVVDQDDSAFDNPTKPIGPLLDLQTAQRRAQQQGWAIRKEPGSERWRRVVPSPRPQRILELDIIADLARRGTVVIAAGGGGLPVVHPSDQHSDDRRVAGIEAVIDKDLASSLIARQLGADIFLISTAVERVALDFGTPDQRWIDALTTTEARRLLAEGEFPAGSMGPKIEAVVSYVEETAGLGLITDPPHLVDAWQGNAGTKITPDPPTTSTS